MIDQITASDLSGSSSVNRQPLDKTTQSRYTRYFFVGMACNFILLSALGFIPDYIIFHLKPEFIVHWSAHFHGAVMATWLLLFLVQSSLAVRGNLKYHRQLGQLSLGLAILVWITMLVVTIRPRITYNFPVADSTWDILLIALFGVVLFAPFFAWGMAWRKNAPAHKRLMLLATIVVMQASVDRLRFLPWLNDAFYVRFLYFDLFLLIPLFIYDLLSLKRIHKVTAIGAALILILQAGVVTAGESTWWHKTAFAIFSPFVSQDVAVKLSDAQIAQLVGNYGDKNHHLTISYENGKMYLNLNYPDVPIFEMFATSDSQTSLLTMAWHVDFIRDKEGRVFKIINNQPDVIWEAARLNE